MKTIFRQIVLFAAIAAPAAASAQANLQNLDALERRLVIALGADIGQPGGPVAPIDRRLRLIACPSDVVVEPAVLNAATLRCSQIGWRIRVPLVRAAAAAAPSAASGAAAGAPGAAAAPAMTAAAPIALPHPQRATPVIRRGDPVEIRAVAGAITVSHQAIAEQDGARGDRIRVRTDTHSDPIVVEVVDAGLVRLPGFN